MGPSRSARQRRRRVVAARRGAAVDPRRRRGSGRSGRLVPGHSGVEHPRAADAIGGIGFREPLLVADEGLMDVIGLTAGQRAILAMSMQP